MQPALGPDATALGQVYWYTIEGRDSEGRATGGWDLDEIRSVQDFYVKYGLNAARGVSEVASIGGFVREYQVDVNPDALKAYDIPLHRVMQAVQKSNKDVGAKTMEINQAEYLVRGLGYIKSLEDIEKAVVAVYDNVPVRISDIAVVSFGPATRRGVLDKDGAEVVGGVVVARYGANPLEVINNVKDKIKEIAPGMPKKTLANGVESQLTIIPFYDRSGLINETLGTLEEALSLQILIVILVVIVMVYNLRASFLISTLLPVAVLMVFIAMRYFGVDANIVALSGIAIAIGTMVDLGVILSENIIEHLEESPPGKKLVSVIYTGASEVSPAILTAVSTTIVSFIPVFTMQEAEGKLFGPLAFTKTFALVAALIVSLFIMPALAHLFFGIRIKSRKFNKWLNITLLPLAVVVLIIGQTWAGLILLAFGVTGLLKDIKAEKSAGENKADGVSAGTGKKRSKDSTSIYIRVYKDIKNLAYRLLDHSGLLIVLAAVLWLLARYWLPLGPGESLVTNLVFVSMLVAVVLGLFLLLQHFYKPILHWCLDHKISFLMIPAFMILFGVVSWLGLSSF